jgi:hypothetical protein
VELRGVGCLKTGGGSIHLLAAMAQEMMATRSPFLSLQPGAGHGDSRQEDKAGSRVGRGLRRDHAHTLLLPFLLTDRSRLLSGLSEQTVNRGWAISLT